MTKPQRMTAVISVSGLVKNFGASRALDHLDLTVRPGEVHGFLGPNGAGKTTTIRVLLGLLRKDAGSVTVLGGDPWRDAVTLHRRLAYSGGRSPATKPTAKLSTRSVQRSPELECLL